MLRVASRRLAGLFLAVSFLGGGFVLPNLDAMLYHSGPAATSAHSDHFDLPGGCGAHAEHCALVASASVRQLANLGFAALPSSRAPSTHQVTISVVVPRVTHRTFLHPSRAPPLPAS